MNWLIVANICCTWFPSIHACTKLLMWPQQNLHLFIWDIHEPQIKLSVTVGCDERLHLRLLLLTTFKSLIPEKLIHHAWWQAWPTHNLTGFQDVLKKSLMIEKGTDLTSQSLCPSICREWRAVSDSNKILQHCWAAYTIKMMMVSRRSRPSPQPSFTTMENAGQLGSRGL